MKQISIRVWAAALVLCVIGILVQADSGNGAWSLRDKTLVAWVYLSDLNQKGGSALTIDNLNSQFDGIVFGEMAPGRWMAGSDQFKRAQKDQQNNAAETADPATPVQIAVVYQGASITIYRNAQKYADYAVESQQEFSLGSVAILGLRHLEAGDRACLAGSIDDARIYNGALTPEQIHSLTPNQSSEPKPFAWWTFENGKISDEMGIFPESVLIGAAKVDKGRLWLDGKESYLVGAAGKSAMKWLTNSQKKVDDLLPAVRQHRARLLNDPQRPVYHFVSPEGYCMPFDPNGAIYWKGQYHLCYIFQDERGHCWGHASSSDLVHWRFHPPALAPNPGDVDQGIFSGNAFVNKKGEAVLLYHGVNAGNCIATCSEDDLNNWMKLKSNPIIPSPKEGDPEFGKYRSWDPHGWLEGETYYAIFGGNPATLFKSDDMVKWTYQHNFLSADLPGIDADEDISCPDFFPIGDKHMLLCISHKRGCRYYLGRWENETFYPEFHARMNWPGGTCFAPESLLDGQGRRIMWAWVLDRRSEDDIRKVGWSGMMTLPRVLSLDEKGALKIEPIPEIETLRANPQKRENIAVAAGSEIALDGISGDSMEIALTVTPKDAREFGIKVRCSPNEWEQTAITCDLEKKCLRIDMSKSTLDPRVKYRECCMYGGNNPEVSAQEAPFELAPGEPLQLRIFLDHSMLEVFANSRQCLTQPIYPTRSDSRSVILFSRAGDVLVDSLDSWEMTPSNPW